ncbi:hypothetical protein BHM03_00011349 [Ensete ventricosum]|nr:hypothetical protein BHM03_00011349 [Ensete ventricosum]
MVQVLSGIPRVGSLPCRPVWVWLEEEDTEQEEEEKEEQSKKRRKTICKDCNTDGYRRLGLFPPHYHPKSADNDRFGRSPADFEQYQLREKEQKEEEEEGEERGEPRIQRCSPVSRSVIEPSRDLPTRASRGRRHFYSLRGEKKRLLA